MSRTGPVCPHTVGYDLSMRPVWGQKGRGDRSPTSGDTPSPPPRCPGIAASTFCRGRTRKAPPPLASTMMATKEGLTAQKVLSQVTRETRMSS